MEARKIFKDMISFSDGFDSSNKKVLKDRLPGLPCVDKLSTLWKKTEVLASQADVILNPHGKSSFAPGCPFTSSTNMVPIGGVEYAMEKLFGVSGTQFTVPTLYDQNGIGLPNSVESSETYKTPDGNKSIIYRHGHFVQLFGIGITGTAENDVTVYPVNYRENGIGLSRVTDTGLTLTGTMLPFRYTTDALSPTERKQYFGKKQDSNGYTGYYLKRFESDAVIKHIWKTGEDTEDETLVSSSDVWNNASGTNDVESFTEIVLKISKKDVREWFNILDQSDRTRINTLALFNGLYIRDDSNSADYGDYQDVRLFSKLNIPVENLTLAKDLNIIYRVYGA